MSNYNHIETWIEVNEPMSDYNSFGLINDSTYKTIGCRYDVHNELRVSKCELGLLVNFGESSLKYKRLVLTKE